MMDRLFLAQSARFRSDRSGCIRSGSDWAEFRSALAADAGSKSLILDFTGTSSSSRVYASENRGAGHERGFRPQDSSTRSWPAYMIFNTDLFRLRGGASWCWCRLLAAGHKHLAFLILFGEVLLHTGGIK